MRSPVSHSSTAVPARLRRCALVPSSSAGQALVADSTNPFFNDAPVGEIFTNRSQGVVAQVKGSEDSVIQDNVFGAVLDQISQGEITDGDAAWSAAILSPRPTQRAAASAAASVTRTSSRARLRSGLGCEVSPIGPAGYRVGRWLNAGD